MKIDRSELADLGRPTQIARAVLRQLDIEDGHVPIEEIARACDITAIEELDNPPFVGCLVSLGKAQGTILLKSGQSDQRRRFTIAHELGHFLNPWHVPHESGQGCSDDDMSSTSRREGNKKKKIEAQANEFAAEILMPHAGFMKRIKGRDPSTHLLNELQETFVTSKQATALRLVKLSSCPTAVVTAQQGRIVSIYRGNDFPFIHMDKGAPLPGGSVSRIFDGEQGVHSPLHEVEAIDWEINSPEGSSLFEQVQVQAQEYRTTVLWLDLSEALDDDDIYAMERASQEPYFH